LCGKGAFTLITGIGGEAWVRAAQTEARRRSIAMATHVIGAGDWARGREFGDSGCVLVRPDHHIVFRAHSASNSAAKDLAAAFTHVLGK
jgi:2,4-dichlorophenol 6-monooxygenase